MTDEEINDLIEALEHGRSTGRRTYYSMAADALVELKARAEAAEKDAAALRVVMERIAKESMDYQYVAQAALEAKP